MASSHDTTSLKQALAELEQYKENLKRTYGPNWINVRTTDGKSVSEPVITALVNGYAALHGITL